ncbi:hypothetical protein HAX54_038025, partial [Datura stramonium]|nr:hypothetical protein [Datura stramonium]
MPPKFQHIIGGARRGAERTDTTHNLRDGNTDSKGEIEEIGTEEPSSGYQTRCVARKHAKNPQPDGGADSSVEGSSSSNDGSNSDEEIGNEATRSPARDSEQMRGNVLKDKTLGLRDSLRWQVGTFVDRAITTAFEPYKNLHAHIDDIEALVNDRLKELIMPDLARFWESEEDVPFIDLLGEQPKVEGKRLRDGVRSVNDIT